MSNPFQNWNFDSHYADEPIGSLPAQSPPPGQSLASPIGYDIVFMYHDTFYPNVFNESLENSGNLEPNNNVILHYVTTIGDTSDTCAICQENYTSGQTICELECHHLFHISCIDNWGIYKQECPMCRRQIPYHLSYLNDSSDSEDEEVYMSESDDEEVYMSDEESV